MAEAKRRASTAGAVTAYRRALVRWYRRSARDLPWRREPTPYRVWVSEIMLQQTRVDTVLAYYDRFLARFPTVEALAEASREDVLEAWSGLGYYRRAKALHDGAKILLERHDGVFPRSEAPALALPGIGRYTAGAIRSIAYGERAPILDGNVMRVLCRVFGVEGVPTRGDVSRRLWDLAAEVVRWGAPCEVNQAQMELGALVCVPREPSCAACPLAGQCVARAEGRVNELPAVAAKRETLAITRAVLLLRDGKRVLLRRRPAAELLPGLWDLPGAFAGDDHVPMTTAAEASRRLPFAVRDLETLGTVRHAVTYRRIRLDVHAGRVARRAARIRANGVELTDRDGAELKWVDAAGALERALSSPARKILRKWGGS